MEVTSYPVLVLNASYEAVNVVSVRRALTLVINQIAIVEESNDSRPIRTQKLCMASPSVIRLRDYRKIPRQQRTLSRKNILMRDGYSCQYCLQGFAAGELTLDHVIPRSSGGGSTWENLVACCYACNHRKGSKSPEECGMKLARQPKPFSLHTNRQLMRMQGKHMEHWRKYLFY